MDESEKHFHSAVNEMIMQVESEVCALSNPSEEEHTFSRDHALIRNANQFRASMASQNLIDEPHESQERSFLVGSDHSSNLEAQ